MNESLQDLVLRMFAVIEAKDLDGVLNLFAQDAVLIDPHFPTQKMQGKPTIAENFKEAMAGMQSFGYTIVHYFEAADGQSAAVETATHHVANGGMKLNFPQVFVFDAADGHITRMQAYEPYGPHGVVGFFLFLGRLQNHLRGK